MIIVSSFVTPLILRASYKNEKPVKTDYDEERFTNVHEAPNIEIENHYNETNVEP